MRWRTWDVDERWEGGENGVTPTRKTTLPDRSAARWLGVTALRCVYLTNGAVLVGFTLTNGGTQTVPDWEVSSITNSGSVISGNIPQMAIINTNPGYGPDPSHTGTGTVMGVLCR